MRRFFNSALLIGALLLSAAPSRAQNAVVMPNTASQREVSSATLDAVLQLLQEVTITRLDAKVSLESVKVGSGDVQLRGLKLENLRLGVKLSARGAQQLANQWNSQSAADSGLKPLFELIKLGLFTDLEVSFSLRELHLRALDLDSDDLKIEGVFAEAGLRTSPQPVKPDAVVLEKLFAAVRALAFNRAQLEAGVKHLAAKRINLQIEGLKLEALHLGVSLAR